MNQKKSSNQIELQKCITAREKAEAELHEIQNHIIGLQDNYLGKQWWDGNILVQWSRHFNQERDQEVYLHPKDRIFSLSSVFSQPQMQLMNIENQILDNNQLLPRTFAKKNFQTSNGKKKKKKRKNISSGSLSLSQRKKNNKRFLQKRDKQKKKQTK